MGMCYFTSDLRKDPDSIDWWNVSINHKSLSDLREFKDYIDTTIHRTDKINFFDILKYNENVDFDFVREFIPKLKGKEIREALGILESRFFKPKYIKELLRLWVDWNVENKTKGLY